MNPSRRDFLKNCGALVVSFSASSFSRSAAAVQFGTQRSHIDGKSLDSWIAVGSDGSITAYTGKCDFGQGIFTAQTQLVAEELCVSLARVKLVECDTSITPDQGTTSGSQSTPTNFNLDNLALAAATAREALLGMASQRLGEPVDALSIVDGVISGKTGQHRIWRADRQQTIQPHPEYDSEASVSCSVDHPRKICSVTRSSSFDDWPIRVRSERPRAWNAPWPRRETARDGSYGGCRRRAFHQRPARCRQDCSPQRFRRGRGANPVSGHSRRTEARRSLEPWS